MLSRNYSLTIQGRLDAPSVTLFVKIVSDTEDSLRTKPYIFIFPGGFGTNHSHYEDYSCLSTHGNVVFFDPRGCGRSDKSDPGFYTMDNYINDVEEIRKELQLKQIIVLGKSCGAMAAVGFAIRYPESVEQLILAAGAPSFKFLDTAKANVLARGTSLQQEVCEKLWAGNFASLDELNEYFKIMASMYSYKVRLGLPFTPRPVPEYPYSHEFLNRGFGDFLREFNFEDNLSSIQCQTLVLVGDEDWITDKSHSQYMAEKIPNSHLIIFNDASHKLEIDQPELYFDAIRHFIYSKQLVPVSVAQQSIFSHNDNKRTDASGFCSASSSSPVLS